MSGLFADVLTVLLLMTVIALLLRHHHQVRAQLTAEVARLERQNEIGRVLLTDRNLRGVTHHVAETAARLISSEQGHVTLVTDGGRLVLEAATGALAGSVGSAVAADGSMAAWVVKHVQPLLVNDVDAGQRFRAIREHIPVRRSVMLPLVSRGRCIGALGVDNPRGGRPYGAADIETLSDLADYAALTIDAIRAIEELQARERQGTLVNLINSRVRQSLELPLILETAVRELGTALGASRCLVRLRRGGELLPPSIEWTADGVAPLGGRADPGAPLVLQAWRERGTVETSDAREVPAVAGGGLLPGPLAVAAAPILLRGEVIGVIALQQLGLPRAWRAGDLTVMEQTASELAIAIANARLYRSVEDASRELAGKIEELQRVDRLKAQFLANMSHELRTPLNSVIGFSELLLQGAHGKLTPAQRDALETVARNGRHLLELVNDVLDLSKIAAGRMELHLAAVDLARLVPDVLAGMNALIQAKGHVVRLDLGEHPLAVRADEMRARQVLFNLLSNAVKFTPPGGEIAIQSELRHGALPPAADAGAARDAVHIAVRDTGIGIREEDLPLLFSEFSQLDASHARHFEGTGLGLALSRRFMEMHGGRIGVESEPGRGSTFWVDFPVEGP